MPISVACACGKKFQAKDELAGKRVKCPGCGQPLLIPAPQAAKPQQAGAGAQAAKPPAAKKPAAKQAPQPELSPMLGDDLLGDLGSLEKAMNSPGLGDPLGSSALGGPGLGGPGLGANPMMGGWQQQAAPQRKSSGNTVLWVGIGGGVVAAVLVIGMVVAILMRDKPQPISSPDNSVAQNSSSPPETPPKVETPAKPANQSAEIAITPTPTPTNTPTQPLETPATKTVPAPETVTTATPTESPTRRPPSAAKSSSTWLDLGPGIAKRMAKPDPYKGVKLIGPDPVVLGGWSWMVELLPFVGEEERYKKFDFSKSWTESVNYKWLAPVDAFTNPADPKKSWDGWPYGGIGLTHFVGMSGIEETRNDVAAMLPRSDPKAGMFGYSEIAKPEQITDGTSQTIMLIGSGKLAAPWAQGGGGTVRGLREPYFDELSGFGSAGLKEPGTLVMFADGSVKTITAKVSPDVLRKLATIHGADSVDLSKSQDILTAP